MALVVAFLFMIGSLAGWCIELVYRNFLKKSRVKGVFVNPGFCTGPYLPIYGVGLAVMFIITYTTERNIDTSSPGSKFWVFLSIAITMTVIELVGGLFMLKVLNMRLWDYRNLPLNFMGLICPQFSLVWAGIGALYYFLLHGLMIDSIFWLANNLSFSFFIGLFFGVFIIDMSFSGYKASLVKKYGDNNDVVIMYDELKRCIQEERAKANQKKQILNQTAANSSLIDAIERHIEKIEQDAEQFLIDKKVAEKK